ncbi:cobyrinate a,c-diamide synthase [Noviherbaspirillum sedimenti]|uniref:Cobyrinate a,c-diamide synthase n=1 Tax=Noviherbaspirillum sedimenti TaxID=2320865 RepID=A0A3A3FW17_9BURK|nr:cobyrinate a,c-diamide synthase [Noviherbaspirillum sedimenti]RJG00347.1 cobyrinate a,c-diamide synthase [Noviherbaspirillum sedimenti]
MSSKVICPAILISAPASGQGKTTITSAIARLHARQGRRVSVFKCGPDFLDPHWHKLASGRPVYQMDLWMTGEDDIRRRLHAAAMQSDLILIEGVMGLFDGEPSAADLAEKFNIPVLGVIDASAMAGTFAALAYGLRHYRPQLPWAGVLANRVASARHAQMLEAGIAEPGSWLGAVMRNPALTLPERHLGLTVASEIPDALQRLDAAADALADTPLGKMTGEDLQRWAVEFEPASQAIPVAELLAGKTLAVARDAAFCFIYQANLDVLKSLGARLEYFSPIADCALPACDAVWLPGGYPELHAEALGSNASMRESIKKHWHADRPIWAECGGMMALFEELICKNGQGYPMWGLLPGKVRMQERLAALGPQQLTLGKETLRGHTFHYSSAETPLQAVARTARPGMSPSPEAGEAFYQSGSVRASYFHPWFASNPVAASRLFLNEALT